MAFFALQTPFYAIGILGVRLLNALGRNQLLMWFSVVSLAVNVGGNLLLMKVLGVAGIALSTTIVYLVSALLVMLAVRRCLAQEEGSIR